MAIVIDNRASLRGKPGLHAFIVGLSRYEHLPDEGFGELRLARLSSAALSAFRVFDWLRECSDHLQLPISTCRLLLSPSDVELESEPELAKMRDPCTLDAFIEAVGAWREDASTHPMGASFFYFAGHGAQRANFDHVLLLEDFADGKGGLLKNAIDTTQLIGGMAATPTYPDMAQQQLYFLDACRILPDEFRRYETVNTSPIWDVETPTEDNRTRPIFYTAVPGAASYGIKGQQSIFSMALLECLNGGGAERIGEDENGKALWSVTVQSIVEALNYYLPKINAQFGSNQKYKVDGIGLDQLAIRRLIEAPSVDVSLSISPEMASEHTELRVLDEDGSLVWQVPIASEYPHENSVTAGGYCVRATTDPGMAGLASRDRWFDATPPHQAWSVNVRRKAALTESEIQ